MPFIRTTFIVGFVVTFLATGVWTAQANQIEVKFTATNFTGANGAAPNDPVSGTIIYEAFSPKAKIDALVSIDLIIDGHSYSLAEVGFQSSDSFGIYGLVNDSGITTYKYEYAGTNKDDFGIGWSKDSLMPIAFNYSSSLRKGGGAWGTLKFSSFTVRDLSAVPEPNIMTLLAYGLFGIVIFGRKKFF